MYEPWPALSGGAGEEGDDDDVDTSRRWVVKGQADA
jgi:hypothetical protein